MGLSHIAVLLCTALIPPFILLKIVYKMDRVEPEPTNLLMRLFVWGILCALPVIVLELWGQEVADIFSTESIEYAFVSYFLIPGFIEEGMKYAVLHKLTWRHPAFNYKFDAVVYAVFASLGFAAIENVLYVFDYGIGTAVVRAVMAIPGHATFGVIMGAGYAQAKCLDMAGNHAAAKARGTRAWLLAAAAHGAYDFTIMAYGGGTFAVYFIILIILGVALARNCEKHDAPIDPFVTDGEEIDPQ
jgi:RsiW-degrading membrane proteinase PrsW (M82 family)